MLDMTTRHQLARLNAIPRYGDSDGRADMEPRSRQSTNKIPDQRLKYPCHLKTSPNPISPSNIAARIRD